jgi:hypothetical protein
MREKEKNGERVSLCVRVCVCVCVCMCVCVGVGVDKWVSVFESILDILSYLLIVVTKEKQFFFSNC